MIDCEFKPYCTNDCESCKYAKDQKSMQALKDAVENFKSALSEIFMPTANMVIEAIEKMMDAIFHLYPDKRVLHLALHHKSKRTVKKNRNSIFRWVNRQIKERKADSNEKN